MDYIEPEDMPEPEEPEEPSGLLMSNFPKNPTTYCSFAIGRAL